MNSHIFWAKHSPLSTLTGAGLLIMASTRLAFALFCSGALLWVYGFTALVFYSCGKFMPEKGKYFIFLFLTSLFCSLYLLIMSFLNPLLVAANWFFLVLIPPCCTGSTFFQQLDTQELNAKDILIRVGLEAGCLGLLIIAISLIREPLGMGSLSFPGGIWGIREIFSPGENGEGFVPIRLLSASAGGLLILGFGTAIFQYFQSHNSSSNSSMEDEP